jgi:predicted ferric reductase
MKTLRIIYWISGSLLTGIIIYILSPAFNYSTVTVGWEFQTQFMYLSGCCSLSLMVTSMLLSLRIPKINASIGGLDKAYILHKWTGILTSIFVLFHWLGDKVPLLLINLEIIPEPKLRVNISQYSEMEILLYKLGLTLVEIIFYVFVILIIFSLYKRIPYRIFRKTHQLIPVLFLIFAFHSLTVPIKEKAYNHLGIIPLLILVLIGCIFALMALFKQIGKSRKISAVIEQIEYYGNNVIQLSMKPENKSLVHQAGQFAFFQFEHDKEPHPFSIVSTTTDSGKLSIAIKALGDFTKMLSLKLQIGQKVIIEGPYGEFNFISHSKRQIWIAGGIGITPFLAQLETLSNQSENHIAIDLWYCTRGPIENQFPSDIRACCSKASVNFHHVNTEIENHLDVSTLKAEIPDLKNTSIWFCGPNKQGKQLKRELKSIDFDLHNFHSDNLHMR